MFAARGVSRLGRMWCELTPPRNKEANAAVIILDPPDPATSWVRPCYFQKCVRLRSNRPIRAFFSFFSELVGTGRALLKHDVFEML